MALDVQMLRSSFDQALARRPDLTHAFYDELFVRHPAARPLFANADMAAQEKMLAEALVAVMDHLEDTPWLQATLAGLGAKHAGYGVTTNMYDWVGESLITTLANANGGDWTPVLTTNWQEAYGAVVSMMLAGYPAGTAVSATATNEAVKESRISRFLHFFERVGRRTAS